MKNVASIDVCRWFWCIVKVRRVMLPLLTETLTSRKGIDVNEKLDVILMVG